MGWDGGKVFLCVGWQYSCSMFWCSSLIEMNPLKAISNQLPRRKEKSKETQALCRKSYAQHI